MDYMIANVDDVSRQGHYSIHRVGNKYEVRAHSDKSGRNVSRMFDEPMEACKAFNTIVRWVVFGFYADNDRMDFIESGTME